MNWQTPSHCNWKLGGSQATWWRRQHVHAHVGSIMPNAIWTGGAFSLPPRNKAGWQNCLTQLHCTQPPQSTYHSHHRNPMIGVLQLLPSLPQIDHRLCDMTEELRRAATTNWTDMLPATPRRWGSGHCPQPFLHSRQTLCAVIKAYEFNFKHGS